MTVPKTTIVAAVAAVAAAVGLLAGCGSTLKSYADPCRDSYGPDPAGPPVKGALRLALAPPPAFDAGEVAEARAACAEWAAVGVPCEAYQDADDVPDSGAVAVTKCTTLQYAAGSSGTTYLRSRGPSVIAVSTRLHRRLLAHEAGHALWVRGGYWHQRCDKTSILGQGLTCMAPSVQPADGCAAKAMARGDWRAMLFCYGETLP